MTVLMAVVLALLAAVNAAAIQPGVRGTVYGKDPDDPVAGALVVLYGADGFLVDSTYSRDDGSFTLRPPERPGPASVVATLEDRSHRESIVYDPPRSRPVWVPLPPKQESRLKQAGDWVGDKLGAVIGLLVGYGFRVLVEERGAAKRKRDDFLFDLRDLAGRALDAGGFAETAAEVARMKQLVERREDVKDALSTLSLAGKAKARASFDLLRDRVAETETLLTGGFTSDVDKERKLKEARGKLEAIRGLRLG
jgi:hypothetical protein